MISAKSSGRGTPSTLYKVNKMQNTPFQSPVDGHTYGTATFPFGGSFPFIDITAPTVPSSPRKMAKVKQQMMTNLFLLHEMPSFPSNVGSGLKTGGFSIRWSRATSIPWRGSRGMLTLVWPLMGVGGAVLFVLAGRDHRLVENCFIED